MSNYFKLIQNISEDFYSEAPALFSDTTESEYTLIKREIKQATDTFMLDSFHRFRKKTATFSTVSGQQKYVHSYGNITKLYITDTSSNKIELNYVSDSEEFLSRASNQGFPTEYTIYDNKIYLDYTPDAVYTITVLYLTRNYVKGVYTIDASSESGQNNLYLASTTGLSVGQTLIVEANTDREEAVVISSITTNDYITAVSNLTYTHASGTAELHKRTFEYETDEPNFPSEYHDIIEYSALLRLYYDDPDARAKFSKLYMDMYKIIKVESRQTTEEKPYFEV